MTRELRTSTDSDDDFVKVHAGEDGNDTTAGPVPELTTGFSEQTCSTFISSPPFPTTAVQKTPREEQKLLEKRYPNDQEAASRTAPIVHISRAQQPTPEGKKITLLELKQVFLPMYLCFFSLYLCKCSMFFLD